MLSSVKFSYRVWRVGFGESALVGLVDAVDYVEAVEAAERRYGADVQVYLPPIKSQRDSETKTARQLADL